MILSLNKLNSDGKPQWQLSSTNIVLLLLLILIETAVLTWTIYDKSIPCWDTASHKLNSFYVYELLSHPHLCQLNWYRHILAVSQLYPPLFYIVSAFLKFIFGALANTEIFSNMIFALVLFASSYSITKMTFHNKLAAVIAAILCFLYPAIFWSAHSALLDFASVAMVSLSLASFLWWAKKPAIKKSMLFGTLLGLTLLTKNNTPIFFVGPFLTYFILALKEKNSNNSTYFQLKQLFVALFTSLIVTLPWLILAGSTVSQFIVSIQKQNFQVTNSLIQPTNAFSSNQPTLVSEYFNEFTSHLIRFTLQDLSLILSPLLLVCFVFSLTQINPVNKNKIHLISSIIFAIITASLFRWPHQFRYILPLIVPISALTAGFLALMWHSKKNIARFCIVLITTLAIMQIIFEAFGPYPFSFPDWANQILQLTHEEFKTKSYIGQMPGLSVSPFQKNDLSIDWCLSKIETKSKKPTYLMIMPNADPLNCSSFYYLTKIRKDNIEVGSPREHTELGDKVHFDVDKALWYQWYILKTGDQGLAFCDTKSAIDYSNWLKFVSFSGKYKLLATKNLVNGDTIELYKKDD